MSYATEHIASTLKAAREARGLSQRALSTKAGVPQSHISKIENGAVDLRVSSLVALARVLDLELMLVPRKTVSAVQSLVRSSALPEGAAAHRIPKALAQLRNAISRLPAEKLTNNELAQFQRNVRELENFQLSQADLENVRESYRVFKSYLDDPVNRQALREASAQLRTLRNFLAHRKTEDDESASVRPAYSLDEDDHG